MNGIACNHDDGCITCGDVGVPLEVVVVHADGIAVCRDERGAFEDVDVSLVEGVEQGAKLLVHARVALLRLDPGAADCALGTAYSRAERAI